MSDPILSEFDSDLGRVLEQLELIEQLRKFASQADQDAVVDSSPLNEYLAASHLVLQSTKKAHSSLAILEGTLVLYIAGRFEEFVRSSIEDICDRLIMRHGSFTALPKAMQDSLIRQTATVMLEPRKYGHAENGVRSFVATLAANFANQAGVTQAVNSQCLSITDANMRAEVIADLFKRVGVKDIWKSLGTQALILALFQTVDAGAAEAAAKKLLNELMDDRNRVAHPSGSFDWPASEKVAHYVRFLKAIATALNSLIPVFEASAGANEPPATAK